VRKKNKKKEKKVQRPIVFQGIKEKVFLEESTTFNSDLKFPQQLNRKKKITKQHKENDIRNKHEQNNRFDSVNFKY
jgi:hypothetical protein